MIEFFIRERVQPLGTRKGQTVYYAMPKGTHVLENETVVRRIVQRTSLAAGDVANTLISLEEIVCEALSNGDSVELGRLGTISIIVSSKMMDSREEVTVEDALNRPKLMYHPTKPMLKALGKIVMRIDHKG
ncbi:MAG: HU family DNA-binding protein [Prevotellaceae bacterium]|nr:HU family DNA-binding protein [Prevotellaceae bacterium]